MCLPARENRPVRPRFSVESVRPDLPGQRDARAGGARILEPAVDLELPRFRIDIDDVETVWLRAGGIDDNPAAGRIE